jgi:DNA ligase-1
MEYSKQIYKKDSSGKIRTLHIYTIGSELHQESGVLGGATVLNKSISKGKNIGRANETTPEEQAILEANSKITQKMRLGYFNSIEEAQEKGGKDFLLPMLAKDYKKEFKKIIYPCYVQPKLDGIRSLGSIEDGFMSRTGKAIDTLRHIKLSNIGEIILDGELYAHGVSFQGNMKLIKKYRSGQTEKVKYHVYDIVMDAPFIERYEALCDILFANPNIELVPTYLVRDEAEIRQLHSEFISQGYEGTMVRHSNEGYAINKRSSSLLKYKDFIDIACKVIDIVPSDKRPEQGICVCELDNGETFSTGMKFSHEERELLLTNKHDYIGQVAEIRFFEYSEDGIPRFPVCVGFRLDK